MRFLASSGLNMVILILYTTAYFHVLSKPPLTAHPFVWGYTISVTEQKVHKTGMYK
jgi:hypothetical protein